jgi:antirestriction protein ArdC
VNPAEGDRLRRAHARLAEAVTSLSTSEGWRRMLAVAARFHDYSPHNVLLIGVQRPDATRVAGYKTWQRLGRHVRVGERGIAILAPRTYRRAAQPDTVDAVDVSADQSGSDSPRRVAGFRVVHVFDINQTDGPDLPDVRPQLLDGAAPDGLWDALAEQVTRAGFTVRSADCAPANGVTDFQAHLVTVRPDLPPAQQVKTLAHELGHVLLHAPEQRPAALDRTRAEVEAESVAFLVTAAHGLDAGDYTVPYVAGWSGGAAGVVLDTAERVLSTASTILAAAPPELMGTSRPPRNGHGANRPAPVRRPAVAVERPAGRTTALAVER